MIHKVLEECSIFERSFLDKLETTNYAKFADS